MNYLNFIHHLDTIVNVATRAYALGGELFSITAILWCLNMAATMIRNVYQAGHTVGTFYWQYLHKYVKQFSIHLIAFAKWIGIHLIALTVLTLQLFWEGCVYIYQNRRMIIGNINNIRNSIGYYFVYQ